MPPSTDVHSLATKTRGTPGATEAHTWWTALFMARRIVSAHPDRVSQPCSLTPRIRSFWIRDSVRSKIRSLPHLYSRRNSWFENVTLANRACGGGISAWKGTNLTDAPGNRYGAYISNSKIIRVSGQQLDPRHSSLNLWPVSGCERYDGHRWAVFPRSTLERPRHDGLSPDLHGRQHKSCWLDAVRQRQVRRRDYTDEHQLTENTGL